MWLGIGTLWIGLICLLLYLVSCEPSDRNLQRVEQGKMSIVYYQGHSYIVWGINFNGGMCHNPDCECYNKDKE